MRNHCIRKDIIGQINFLRRNFGQSKDTLFEQVLSLEDMIEGLNAGSEGVPQQDFFSDRDVAIFFISNDECRPFVPRDGQSKGGGIIERGIGRMFIEYGLLLRGAAAVGA